MFRHTFAINYLRNGGNIAFLQQILGHSSIETTRMYLHITSEDLQQNFDDFCTLDNAKRKGIKLKM
ncbi:tyrosine-type recombinase/integrase [Holtiella tumoricola]|uniref:tyrosine-type recombinase/integrase n=1 Tax=Holtiella tumoricola TaxID=3018743 RepID=UPI002FE6CDB9